MENTGEQIRNQRPEVKKGINTFSLLKRKLANILTKRPLPEEEKEEIFESHGLYARNFGFAGRVFSSRIIVNGEKMLEENDPYTHIDFMPRGTQKPDSSKITNSIASGIKGLKELFAAVDKGEMSLSPVVVGTTNLKMAEISQRLGFTVVDSCRGQDGAIIKSMEKITVVGRLDDIRKKFAEFSQSELSKGILERDERLKDISLPV